MALAGALCVALNTVVGFHQQEPSRAGGRTARPVLQLVHQMTYDLRRLRLNGLIERVPRRTPMW